MIEVTIHVPPGLVGLPELVSRCLPEIAEGIRNEAVALVQTESKTGGADYIQGLNLLHIPLSGRDLERGGVRMFAVLVLTGWLPNAIEEGWEGGDMKPFLLAGRNAKVGKDGKRYNTVPFRHGTPGTSGRYFQAMGDPYSQASRYGSLSPDAAKQLGRDVYAMARRLAPTTSHPSTGTSWGGRLPEGVGGAGKLREHHKTDLHAGMVRKEKTYEKATQNLYMTFRRVSENSDPRAFVHPGIQARRYLERAQSRAGEIADIIFHGAIQGMEQP